MAPKVESDANGLWWYADPARGGYKHGPWYSEEEALDGAVRIAKRDRALAPTNPHGQEMNVDVPDVGYRVMSKENVDAILGRFDALMLADPTGWQSWHDVLSDPGASVICQALQNRGMTRAEILAKLRDADANRGGQWHEEPKS